MGGETENLLLGAELVVTIFLTPTEIKIEGDVYSVVARPSRCLTECVAECLHREK